MGACSSSAKNLGWAVAQRRCLNALQGATPDVKVPNQLASSLHLCFIKASPKVEKAVMCYKADRLITSLPSFCSIQQYANFVVQ